MIYTEIIGGPRSVERLVEGVCVIKHAFHIRHVTVRVIPTPLGAKLSLNKPQVVAGGRRRDAIDARRRLVGAHDLVRVCACARARRCLRRRRGAPPGIEGRAHRDLGRVRNRVASAVAGVLAVPPARVT